MDSRPISLLVGVNALTKATGSWPERAIGHTGTETRPRLLQGRQQWGILRNGRKPDAATPREG